MKLPPVLFAGWALFAALAQAGYSTHPRLFFDAGQIPEIRAKAQTPEGRSIVEAIRFVRDGGDPFGPKFHKDFGNSAILYLASGDKKDADLARDEMLHYIAQPDIWANPKHKGLRRGALARGGAISYDLCYEAWKNQTVPERVVWKGKSYDLPKEYIGMDLNTAMSKALLSNAESLLASGGAGWPSGNKFGNNWYGVRYGGAVLSLLATDEGQARELLPRAMQPLQRYIETSLGTHSRPTGWNPEGYGYTLYPAQFTFPAILAVRRLSNPDFVKNVPAVQENLVVIYHGLLPLPQKNAGFLGLHPDFQDDNADWTGEGAANLAFAFAPDSVKPALKWIYNRSFGALGDKRYDSASCGGLYALLFYPLDLAEKNPAEVEGFGRTLGDRKWGFVSFRKNHGNTSGQDVLTQFMVKTGLTDGGHNGPDGLGYRIWGLGVPWTTGSGSTIKPGGQCTVFAGDPDSAVFQGQVHEWLDSDLRDSGGGFIVGRARPFSDVGTKDHTRRYLVDYDPGTGAEAVFVVADTTENGKFWRLNTPGFGREGPYNHITTNGSTFAITNAFTGDRLEGTVLYPASPVFRTGDFQRGSAMSAPVGEKALEVTHNYWIDISHPGESDGGFLVVLSLLRKGATAPSMSLQGTPASGTVTVGSRSYRIDGTCLEVQGWERPDVKIMEPAENGVLSGAERKVTLNGTVSSPSGAKTTRVQILQEGQLLGTAPVKDGQWSFQTPVLESGLVRFSARATDEAGGTGEALRNVRLTNTQPPAIAIVSPVAGVPLPAGEPLTLHGTAIDPEGKAVGVELFLGNRLLGKPRPAKDGAWSTSLPAWASGAGHSSFRAVATDADGDTAESEPLELTFSARFSDHPEFGDLANWTRRSDEWRVDLFDDSGNARYRVVPSEGYKKRFANSLIANRTFEGDFFLSFKARLLSPESVIRLLFGREVYLELGNAKVPGGLRYTGWGDKPIGAWEQPFFTDDSWHTVGLVRKGNSLTLRRDGKDFWSMRLKEDRSFSESLPGLVKWDKTFGAREKYRWYVNFWAPGPIGLGVADGDASSFLVDDFLIHNDP